jgi:tetratricopeptide (TPR) repeat protein
MDTLGKRYCWVRWAELALLQDDPALALDIIERLIASAPGISPGRVITYLWQLKGDALAALGQSEAACSWLRAALDNARDLEERFLLWRVQASLGQRYLAMNDSIEARKAFSAARTLIDELGAAVSDEVLKDKFLQGAYNSLDLHLGGDR